MGMPVPALDHTTEGERETSSVVAPVFSIRNVLVAASLFAIALFSIWEFQTQFNLSHFGVSTVNYFTNEAQSFLHGRWDLDVPASRVDIVVVHGKHYIVYPPMPAIVLMPFVAIFGLNTSDILFTAVCSALNLSVLYLLLEQVRANGFTRRVWLENACIAVLLWYGSISLWLSLGGRMWFTAQILCMTFTLLALLVAFRRHYALAAVLLGCAFFCRSSVLLGYLFLYYLAWQDAGTKPRIEQFVESLRARKPDWAAVPWRRLLPPIAVTAGVLLLFMLHNTIIFGSPLDSGYNVLNQQRYRAVTKGLLNIKYVPANIMANFFTFPQVTFKGPFDRHPVLNMLNNDIAVSVFVTTPLFLFLFWRNRSFSATRAALWITIGLIVIVTLLYDASGWRQFGARYLVDGYPFAFLLLALNDVRVDWRFAVLGYLGIIINILGALQFWTGIIPHL
jgi:hypothetical protein